MYNPSLDARAGPLEAQGSPSGRLRLRPVTSTIPDLDEHVEITPNGMVGIPHRGKKPRDSSRTFVTRVDARRVCLGQDKPGPSRRERRPTTVFGVISYSSSRPGLLTAASNTRPNT